MVNLRESGVTSVIASGINSLVDLSEGDFRRETVADVQALLDLLEHLVVNEDRAVLERLGLGELAQPLVATSFVEELGNLRSVLGTPGHHGLTSACTGVLLRLLSKEN